MNTPMNPPMNTHMNPPVNPAFANRIDLNLLVWDSLDATARRAALRRPTQDSAAAVRLGVGKIIARVRADGDAALRKFSRLLDRASLDVFAVSAEEFDAAEAMLDPELKAAIIDAAGRIDAFHRDSGSREYTVETAPGVQCRRIVRPIARVGLYIPAGSAPLPSTMLMLGVPARIAGCEEVVVCTPPRVDGTADPAVLFAARQCGVRQVFKLGGAHAIAAMAIGTESVPACDKLFGPGNAWVTEAKRQVSTIEGGPAIDMPAGPSELLVIADGGANPAFVAADLLSQAEHGPDSQVILLSDSDVLIAHVARAMVSQLAPLPRAAIAREALSQSRLIRVGSIADAFVISNRYAPEHLILALREPESWLDRVRVAGSVFLGDYAAEALGDYCSGTNHVLPTGGAARAWSGLSVTSFQTSISVQSVTGEGLQKIGPSAIRIAAAEGLQAHANAVSIRMAALQAAESSR
jgi:histidinol dehydrogenase